MVKLAISVTLDTDNLTWLKGRTGATGLRSVSELLNQLVKAARQSGRVGPSRTYRGADAGYRLKLAQRERALAQGITRITWTFDPLQSLNAYFNFRKLGVVSNSYRINFYGEETSSFLHRIGTDRLWVTWLLDSGHVRNRLAQGSPHRSEIHEGRSGQRVQIEIPTDINTLQRQHPKQAIEWREATRRAFTEALTSGFLVEDFFRQTRGQQSVGMYVLNRERTMEDFA